MVLRRAATALKRCPSARTFAAIIVLLCMPVMVTAQETDRGTLLLNRALDAAGLCRHDLFIPSIVIEDPRETPLFRRWMTHPLKAPLEGQHRATRFLTLAYRPDEWLTALPLLQGLGPLDRPPSPPEQTWHLDDRLSPQTHRAIASMLDAVSTARGHLRRAFAALTPEDMHRMERRLFPEAGEWEEDHELLPGSHRTEEMHKALEALDRVDMEAVLVAGTVVVRAAWQAARTLARDTAFLAIGTPMTMETPLGTVRIGGYGNDVHEGPALLIIDPAGDDLYRGPVASAGPEECSIVIDLEGDDVYLGEEHAQGYGYRGVGLLMDLEGDDLYRARDGAQGAAVLGTGMLVDVRGDDQYLGGRMVQAAAAPGYAGLIDLEGDDLYQGTCCGQAYSRLAGTSCLTDACGNDRYIAGTGDPDPREPDMRQSFAQGFAMGYRGLCPGGAALLAEGGGNDVYQAQYFAQGASYWKGTGLLYDHGGRDVYTARRYAQGAGIHSSFGMLLDTAGDDVTTSWGVSQGCGHDWGVGILVNESGNDVYAADWLSMGASEANGIGIFADNRGCDGYETRAGAGTGGMIPLRRSGGMGLFMDADGPDRYSQRGSNDRIWASNRWAVGADAEAAGVGGLNLLPVKGPLSVCTNPAEARRREERERLEGILEQVDGSSPSRAAAALLAVASHWGHEKVLPQEAENRLLAMDPTLSVPVLAPILDTPDIMELLTIHRVFRVYAFHAIPLLVEQTRATEPLVRIRAIQGLGMLRDTRTLDVLLNGLEEENPGVRAAAARAVGDLLEKRRLRVLCAIRDALDRSHEQSSAGPIMDYLLEAGSTEAVLSIAARAFPLDYADYSRFLEASTARGDEAALEDCAASLFQHRSALRPILERWIRDIDRPHGAIRSIRPLLKDPEPLVRANAAYSLGQMDDTTGMESLVGLLKDDDPRVRDAAALSLVLFGDRAVEPVRLAMARGDRRMRIIGLDLLGRIDTPGSRAGVSEYLDDPARAVREAAERALGLQQP